VKNIFESLKTFIMTEEDLSRHEILPGDTRFDRTGIPHTEETKQLMRRPRSEETKQKMRKPRSKEAKKRMSEGQKGKLGPNRGKKFTDKHKRSLSESHKGQIPWNKGKTGLKYNTIEKE